MESERLSRRYYVVIAVTSSVSSDDMLDLLDSEKRWGPSDELGSQVPSKIPVTNKNEEIRTCFFFLSTY